MINWDELGKFGVSKEMLEQSGQLDSMLKGYKTNKTMPLTLSIPGGIDRQAGRTSLIHIQRRTGHAGHPRHQKGTGT